MRDIDISRVMTTDPAIVSPDDNIERARSLLESAGLNHLPVVEDGRLAGIVSSADLLKCYLLDGSDDAVGSVAVRSIMATDPVTLAAGSSLRDAALKLSAGGFHALPVIEPDRTLIGIVTSTDLIEHLLHQLPASDGSLRPPAPGASNGARDGVEPDDEKLRAAISAARQIRDRGEEDPMAEAVLGLDARIHRMQDVCKAAELYMRTGHAEREHSVLIRKLKALNDIPESVYL
jgi:CBS domain-containing protein